MRLDARNGDVGYRVYDLRTMREVAQVVWCDSDTAQWGSFCFDYSTRQPLTITRQEKRIDIFTDIKLVLFNKVDDDNVEDLWTTPPIAQEVSHSS